MDVPPTDRDPLDEQRLRLVANKVPALLAYIDRDARYVWCNEAYLRWFGRAAKSLPGLHVREVVGEEAWAVLRPHVERALAGEEVTFERRMFYDATHIRDVRASYVPERDAEGRVRGFVAMVTDVTEVRTAEEALRASERMLAESQRAAQVGSWEAILGDEPGAPLRLRWSDETYRIFGHAPGAVEVDYALFIASIHPDDRERVRTGGALGGGSGDRFEKEYRIVRPDGAVRVIHGWSHVERDATGRLTRLLGTCQDITERKRAEQEARQAREQLQLVVDATPALIARFDRDTRLVWSNRSYAARFGVEPEALVGRPLREIIGAEAYESFSAHGVPRVLSGETIELEAELTYPTLGRRSMHVVASPTLDARGAVDGSVAILTDDTHRRELERERERALTELRESDQRKDEFLAMLSHELRNPLAPILTAVEVLRLADPNDAETAATFHGLIERQVLHMRRLLDDLLDVSRVNQGKIELRRELVELTTVMRQAVEVSQPLIAGKEQRLTITTPGAAVFVDADPARLVQVFGNLLNNAAKYSDPGGAIEIALAVEGDEAVVRVRDEGLGMSPDLLERAFELFVQESRSLDRAQGGMGIGLTMVRRLVEMHGGSARAFSAGPGQGCEIVVRLPRATRTELPVPCAETPRERTNGAGHLRVLVVDDNVDAARTLGHLLGLLGHEVRVAHDGPSALATFAKAPPELVFIDIGLPGMDGYALASALRAPGVAPVSLVAVTGYGRHEDVQRSVECGFDHHLVKPVDLPALRRIPALRGEPRSEGVQIPQS
jgi:PAS domain S-box-containing protein